MDQPETLPAAVSGAYGVFSVTDCKHAPLQLTMLYLYEVPSLEES
jgi:hypothetical protein